MIDQPPSVLVRIATPEDLETVVGFNRAMAEETEAKTLDPAVATAGVRTGLADSDRCRYFLAERGGSVVGQTMLTTEWSDWRNGYFWWIQSVYVAPSQRRRGIFKMLYEHVNALARREPDVRGLRLYVHRDNHRALTTYRRLGMTLTEYLMYEEEW